MLQENHIGNTGQRAVPTDEDGDHDASTESSLEIPSVGRRPLLKALGVGAALSVGSGVAAADHDTPHPSHIDSHYGYATPDADDIPKKLEPDHTVELHVGAPTPGEYLSGTPSTSIVVCQP